MFVLRVLSELSLVLLVEEGHRSEDDGTEIEIRKREQGGREAEGTDEGSQVFTLLTKSLLPRLV